MRYDEFLKAFALRVSLPKEEAARVVEVGLETLAERITGTEAADLAAQLPEDLKPPLLNAPEEAADFDWDEFVRRVQERADVDADRAELAARALLATLADAVTTGEFEDVLSQLPKEYAAMIPPKGWVSGPPPEPRHRAF
jgi:uncharacterized protein (DUF2267 family)